VRLLIRQAVAATGTFTARSGVRLIDGCRGIVHRHRVTMSTAMPLSPQPHSVEACRLANASARMMGSFQDGMRALDRVRRGGKQTVTVKHVVQHVTVEDGGQGVTQALILSIRALLMDDLAGTSEAPSRSVWGVSGIFPPRPRFTPPARGY
jgi:hypothetical protein